MSRKKVLIITYYWPPSGGSGVQRWLKFTKYLRRFDWEPVIYTPENPEAPAEDKSLLKDIPENATVLKTPIWEPYSFYKKFTGQEKESKIGTAFLSEESKPKLAEKLSIWVRGNFFIPDARKSWIKPSVRYLVPYLKDHPVDAIVTTGPPHSMHLIGMKLRDKLDIPWLADFRDPWTEIDFYQDLMLTKRADRKHHKLEAAVLKKADRVIVVSPTMKRNMERIRGRTVDLLTNGYDAEDYAEQKIPRDEKFSISYIGNFVKTQNPPFFWEVLADLVQNEPGFKDDLEIQLIGKTDYNVQESIRENGLISFISESNYVPHAEVTKYQRKAQVLLLILKKVPMASHFLPGKLFEYLAARRPILCIGPPESDTGEVIRECKAGTIIDYDEKEKMRQVISKYYDAYKKGQLTVEGNQIEKYSRKNLTRHVTEILNEMTGIEDS